MNRLTPLALPCPKCKAGKDDQCVSLGGGSAKAGQPRSRPHDERARQLPKAPPPPCGTYSAHQRHQRLGEPSCEACKRAAADYMAAYRDSRPADYAHEKRMGAARSRALWRLAHDNPETFRQYVTEEMSA